MHSLGDIMLAAIPPLNLRIVADSSKPRLVDAAGKVRFTVGEFQIYCGDKQVIDERERNYAFYFMLYSDWDVKPEKAVTEGNQLVAFAFNAEPVEPAEDQGFQMLGSISGMISRQFNLLTSHEGTVERLSPTIDSNALGIVVPEDYESDVLPLWRFTLHPKFDNKT